MKWPGRRTWLVLALTATIIAAAYPPYGVQAEDAAAAEMAAPSRDARVQGAQPGQAQVGHVELERLTQQKQNLDEGRAVGNAFNAKRWYVPPRRTPPPPPPPPPAPTAPPLPFTYLGRYADPPRLFVILASGDKVYTVSKGEVIDGTYRVEGIGEAAVDLVYLPLNINQSLSVSRQPEARSPAMPSWR